MQYIEKYYINFSDFSNYNLQETNCITEEGLKIALEKTIITRLTDDKRKALNVLLKYLDMPLVNERKILIDELNKEEFDKHDEFIKDIINEYNEINRVNKYQLCMNCDKYYPLAKKFFHLEVRGNTYCKTCNICSGRGIKQEDKVVNKIYKERGDVGYQELIKNHNAVEIYKIHKQKIYSHIPKVINNKEDYIKIIKWLYENKEINKDNISYKKLRKLRLGNIENILTLTEIYKELFGDEFYLYPWEYNVWQFKEFELTYEIASKIFDNYLKENGIIINDIFKFNYTNILKNARLSKYNTNILDFIMHYYNYKYPGYKFDTHGVNYYKEREYRDFDLKWLIEKDWKIEIEKIPLYLTKWRLQKHSNTLRNLLEKYYNNDIYKWVNEVYSDRFIETDFNIGRTRDEFDSTEEEIIHNYLKENLKNVLYNEKHSDFTITLDKKIPDWFVFGNNGVWIIEYFGLYTNGDCSRLNDYRDRTENKIEGYKRLKGYNMIYLYPEDLKDDMLGVGEKIKEIR